MKLNIFVIILLFLIVTVSYTGFYLTEVNIDKLDNSLQKINSSIEKNNWQEAEKHNIKLNKDWKKTEKIFGLIIDHEELHNLETSLAKLESYLLLEQKENCKVEIHLSRRLLEHIKNQESLSLENIF